MRLDPRTIIESLKRNHGKVRQTARELGISPGTVRNWRQRGRSAYGYLRSTGLMRHSTRPKTVRPTTLSAIEQDRVTAYRKLTQYCATKICYELALPYHSQTIHRFLKVKGLTREYGYHRRPLFQDTKHMHAKNVTAPGKLQMDVKVVTPELSGLEHTCYLYAVMDIFSRYKRGVLFPLLDQSFAIAAIQGIVEGLPLTPDFIQTDNGLEFQTRFHSFVTQTLKLQHHYIHKSSPNENAVIERSFRTDEEEFFCWRLGQMGRPQNIFELNTKYQLFMREYNETRPHLGLNLMTPLEKIKSV